MARKVIKLTESDLIKIVKRVIREQQAPDMGAEPATQEYKLDGITSQNIDTFLKFTDDPSNPLLALILVDKLTGGKYKSTVDKIKSYDGEIRDDNNQPKPGVKFMSQVSDAIKSGLKNAAQYGLDPNKSGSAQAFTKILNTAAGDNQFTETYGFLPIFAKIFNIQKQKLG